MTMNTKTALINGPISDETRNRLEAMGFEIVDMEDQQAMEDLRRRLEIENVAHVLYNAIGMSKHEILESLRQVENSFGIGNKIIEQNCEIRHYPLKMEIKAVEPMPDVKIDKKKDRYSFLDEVVSRGKGRARNQGFSKHFKH